MCMKELCAKFSNRLAEYDQDDNKTKGEKKGDQNRRRQAANVFEDRHERSVRRARIGQRACCGVFGCGRRLLPCESEKPGGQKRLHDRKAHEEYSPGPNAWNVEQRNASTCRDTRDNTALAKPAKRRRNHCYSGEKKPSESFFVTRDAPGRDECRVAGSEKSNQSGTE